MAGRVDELACNRQKLLRPWSLDHDAFEPGLADAVDHCKQARPCHVMGVRWNSVHQCRTVEGKALRKTASRYLPAESNHCANACANPATSNACANPMVANSSCRDQMRRLLRHLNPGGRGRCPSSPSRRQRRPLSLHYLLVARSVCLVRGWVESLPPLCHATTCPCGMNRPRAEPAPSNTPSRKDALPMRN